MKQKLREVKEFPLGHTAWKWWSCHLNPGLSASDTQVTSPLFHYWSLMPSAAFCWQRISSSSPQAFTKANLILDALPSAHGDGERPGVDGELEHWTIFSELMVPSLITASMALALRGAGLLTPLTVSGC